MVSIDWDKTTISQKMMRIGRLGWTYARDHLNSSYALSNAQYKVCVTIYNSPMLSQDDVAKSLGMDKSSVAKLVSKLLTTGIVERQINEDDRREYKLNLTEKGEKITEEFLNLLTEWEEGLCEILGESYYPDCQKHLIALLKAAEEMV